MLAAAHRMGDASEFREVTRQGTRAAARTLVVHLRLDDVGASGQRPVSVGLVVGKAVGGSVVRNRVKRRLRHLLRPRLADLPPGARMVVRALPPAAAASSLQLDADLGRCLQRLAAPRPGASS